MPKFINISPQGALDLPLIGRVVKRGETFDVTPEQAKKLATQPDLWQPATTSSSTDKKGETK